MIKLMYITNNASIAKIVENAGVERIFVDMEHKDENGDGTCDECGAESPPEEAPSDHDHTDKNLDGKCDECNNDIADAVALFKNGKTSYSFVISRNCSSTAVKAVDKLAKELSNLGVSIEKLEDESKYATEYEILIGVPTSRGSEYDFDIHTLGYEGYTVRLIGNKLLVAAGSEEALPTAIEYLRSEIMGISDSSKRVSNVYLSSHSNYTTDPAEYRISSVSVSGEDMRGYVIAYDTAQTKIKKIATSIQSTLYKNTGYWLEITDVSNVTEKAIVLEKGEITGGLGLEVSVNGSLLKIYCEYSAKLEEELYTALNSLGIGIMGAGGDTSVLAVNVEYAYTHIAGICVATSSNCMVARRAATKIDANNNVTVLESPDWFERNEKEEA